MHENSGRERREIVNYLDNIVIMVLLQHQRHLLLVPQIWIHFVIIAVKLATSSMNVQLVSLISNKARYNPEGSHQPIPKKTIKDGKNDKRKGQGSGKGRNLDMMAEDFSEIDGSLNGKHNVLVFIDGGAMSRTFISQSTCDRLSLTEDLLKPCNQQGSLGDGSRWSSCFYIDADIILFGRLLGLTNITFRTRLFVLHNCCRDMGVIIGQPDMV